MVHLHGQVGADVRDWKALVRADVGSFVFRKLPQGPEILAPGSYTLEVSAVRIDTGPVYEQQHPAYQAVASRILGISAWERRISAISSRRIPIEIVP